MSIGVQLIPLNVPQKDNRGQFQLDTRGLARTPAIRRLEARRLADRE